MKKILVVDDDNFHRKFAGDVLSKAGYLVVEAENGSDGLDVAIREKPDLVLLDIAMPGIDGIEACSLLKQIDHMEDVPVVMYTSLEEEELINVAKGSGAVDFIVKPSKEPLLLSRVDVNLKLSEEVKLRKKYELIIIARNEELRRAKEEIEELRKASGGSTRQMSNRHAPVLPV